MKKQKPKKVRPTKAIETVVVKGKRHSVPEPIRPCKGRFFDYIIDMYDMPDQVELRHVYSGSEGIRRDGINMRSYFQSARSKVMFGR